MNCIWTKAHILDLKWNMCVYDAYKDVHVSGSILRSGNWEGMLVSKMIHALRGTPNSMLLDIGGNIGYYTLAAAKAGFHVDVFEPVPLNAAMIQASLTANKLYDVNVHTHALVGLRHGAAYGCAQNQSRRCGTCQKQNATAVESHNAVTRFHV